MHFFCFDWYFKKESIEKEIQSIEKEQGIAEDQKLTGEGDLLEDKSKKSVAGWKEIFQTKHYR